MTFRFHFSSSLALLSLFAFSTLHTSHAQTPVTTTGNSGVAAVSGSTPSGTAKRVGAPVVVAAAIDSTGNADNAKQALRFANQALLSVPGYTALTPSDYAALTKADARGGMEWPFTATDYQKLGKSTKVGHALTVEVTPANGGFETVAEMYDTKRGALIGHSKGVGSGEEALRSSVNEAVWGLSRTVTLDGVVLSKSGSYNTRLSLGTLAGARGGARVEYLGDNGQPIAYGTIFDIGAGEAVATVAPEAAYGDLFVNQRVRLVNNPVAKRATPSATEEFGKEYDSFERSFGLAAGAAAVYYLLVH